MVDHSVAAYYTITSTEAGSNLARYDNIRYGYELDGSGYEYHRYVTRARDGFGPEVKRPHNSGGFCPLGRVRGQVFPKGPEGKEPPDPGGGQAVLNSTTTWRHPPSRSPRSGWAR